jgi:hypothetical protein
MVVANTTELIPSPELAEELPSEYVNCVCRIFWFHIANAGAAALSQDVFPSIKVRPALPSPRRKATLLANQRGPSRT